MDPFATLALAPRFDLDHARIQAAYLQAVGSAHPDASASAGAASSGGAGDPARPDPATINEARRILADPERRADALLRRLGGPPSAQERGLPEGFLMEVMEVRQQIEADLAADPAAARSRWETWAEQRRAERQQAVAAMFQALADPPAPDALRDIRIQLNAWRYIERLIEQLDPEYDPAVADFDH